MAPRRSISHHPAFVPLVALWFAALFGLAVAVLPAPLVARIVAAAGLAGLLPAGGLAHWFASALAALGGGLLGLVLARLAAFRGHADPRPVYREPDPAVDEPPASRAAAPRPLRVREDLDAGLAAEASVAEPAASEGVRIAADPLQGETEGFMILTPQPVHPPHPPADLDTLLEQFDHAIAAFQADAPARPAPLGPLAAGPDPVHSFVARQTGAPPPAPAPSPLGGLVPDHQAELRAALDKLAKAMRER